MEDPTSIKLRLHAETCQMEAEELAYKLGNLQKIISLLAPIQSICDFNLIWLYSVAPNIIIHDQTLEFLQKHITEFKRKLKQSEIIDFDWIITQNNIENFDHFKTIIQERRKTKSNNVKQ